MRRHTPKSSFRKDLSVFFVALMGLMGGVSPLALAQAPLTPGTIVTVAGRGKPGFYGDGGQAAGARLNSPLGLALDGAGNLYLSDPLNHRVRRISPSQTIFTVAGDPIVVGGTALGGFYGDNGPANAAELRNPNGLATDTQGNLYIADQNNHRIRRVTPEGVITTFAGSGPTGSSNGAFGGDGGPATSARLNLPASVAVDQIGNVYIADSANHRIRKVSVDSIITTVAGTGEPGFFGDGGPATSALLNNPDGLAADGAGNLFIADTDNHRIRKVDANGIITTVAGIGIPGFAGDNGLSLNAQLSAPRGVAVDSSGRLFIADTGNHRIRHIDPNGLIQTFAGTGAPGYAGDNGPAAAAQINLPVTVALDAAGNVFIAERDNHIIRKVFNIGSVGYLAGNPFDNLPSGVIRGGPPIKFIEPGDVNGDGVFDMRDVAASLAIASGSEAPVPQNDVNQDGRQTLHDTEQILREALSKKNSPPIFTPGVGFPIGGNGND